MAVRGRRATGGKPSRKARRGNSGNAPQPRFGVPLFLLVLIVASTVFYSACGSRDQSSGSQAPQPQAPPMTREPERPRPEPPGVTMTEEPPAPQPAAPEPAPSPKPEPRPDRIEEPVVRLGNNKPQPARSEPKPERVAQPARTTGFAREWTRNVNATDAVALTFDGSYGDAPLGGIISILQQHGYRATFFLTGTFVRKFPNSVKHIANAGMEIGNHSWTHPRFTALSESRMATELGRTSDAIAALTGQRPRLFRPPYGARDDRVLSYVSGQGYQPVYWGLDCLDSVKKDITADDIAKRVLDRVRPGDIVLMHINSVPTRDALPRILEGLEKRGLKVATVSEVMER